MLSIFYDLETTDKNTVGQILNFAFVVVDENFNIIDEYCNNILISRLQLPSPGAILANKTNVIEHQKKAKLKEVEAMRNIFQFISKYTSKEKIPLIGYNSNKFDLPYLRTSLIRNGINPYFGGKLIYKDLLFAARKLHVTHPDFPLSKIINENNEPRLSLTLESLCKNFSILSSEQKHESREDVLITIELAKIFLTLFSLDVRNFEAYEASKFHQYGRGNCIIKVHEPEYDLHKEERFITKHLSLLDSDHRYALWIDLDKFKENENEKSIHWFNQASSQIICEEKLVDDEDLKSPKTKLKKLFFN
jgi:Exonuclease